MEPINTNPIQQIPSVAQSHERKGPSLSVSTLILTIVVSMMAGAAGGVFGVWYGLKIPGIDRALGSQSGNASLQQSVSLTEDSAVIDVVKKTSPAVVSIVISKDLSKIPGYGINPFENDPFFNFFFNNGGGQQPAAPTSPNVQQVGAGTGFFISSDGLILTNKHVVEDTQASYTVLTSDGKKYDAQVLSRDPVNDLAIVKVNIQNAPKLSLADSSQLQVGQRVIAIGNSLGQYQNTVTTGIVSGIGRRITAGGETGSEELSGVIQTDAAINPGNSGGPLLNVVGQVIGINTAVDQQGQLVGFAIPSNAASKAVTSFQKSGKITRPYLGVRYVIITADVAQQEKLPKNYGALVIRGQNANEFAVIPGSPADKAGLVENDIIEEVNGQQINENHTLTDALGSSNAGDTVTMKVYDKGSEKTVQVTLGETK